MTVSGGTAITNFGTHVLRRLEWWSTNDINKLILRNFIQSFFTLNVCGYTCQHECSTLLCILGVHKKYNNVPIRVHNSVVYFLDIPGRGFIYPLRLNGIVMVRAICLSLCVSICCLALWRTAPGDTVLERSVEILCIQISEGPAT